MKTYSLNKWNFELTVPIPAPHKYWPAGSPVPAGYCAHLEGAVPLAYGMLLSHNISDTVEFDGAGAVQVGHDIGLFIPQYNIIPPAPPNIFLAVTIPTSQAKVTFFKGSVVVQGKCAGNYDWLAPMWLNVCAEPVNLPLGQLVDAPFRNTVIFGFTWTDFLRGLLNTAVDSALSKLISVLMERSIAGRLLTGLGESAAQKIGYLIFQKLIPDVFKNVNEELLAKILNKYIAKALKKGVPLPGGLTGPLPESREAPAPAQSGPSPGDPPSPAQGIVDSAPLIGGP